MIRRQLDDHVLLVRQDDHARHAGRLVSYWNRPPAPFTPIVRAVTLHDAGWSLLDDAPEPLPDGRAPHVFDLRDGVSLPAWRRSVALAREAGPREALLVSGHFSRFDGPFGVEQAPLQAAWRHAAAGRESVDPEWERQGIELIRVCDAISLRMLCDPAEPLRLGRYRWEPDPVSADSGGPAGAIPVVSIQGCLDPWPFAVDWIDESVTGKRLQNKNWSQKQAFLDAYKAAPKVKIQLVLRPL